MQDIDLSIAQGQFSHFMGTPVDETMTTGDLMDAVQRQVVERRTRVRDIMADIARLQSAHNSVVSINRLPADLLTTIFTFVLTASEGNASLIRISHVCAHWRGVALGAASLWTRIALNHPDGIETFLLRSKTLPVHLSLTTFRTPVKTSLKLITSHIDRIRCLNIRVPAPVDLEFVTHRLKLAAPNLVSLSIEKIQSHRRVERTQPRERTKPTVFEEMPALRTLHLCNVPLLYIPKGPNALRSITLHHNLPRLHPFLTLLESSPQLEMLCIHGTFNGDQERSTRQVALPRLKSVHMRLFPPQGIAALLSALSPSKGVSITIAAHLDIVDDFEDVFPNVPHEPARALDVFAGSLRRLELIWDDLELTLRAFRGADEFCVPALQVGAVHWGPRPGRRFLGQWAFDTARVETLVVCGNYSRLYGRDTAVAWEHWFEAFAALPALRTLRLMSLGDKTLQQVFVALEEEPFCARLETLELLDVAASERVAELVRYFVTRRVQSGALRHVDLFSAGERLAGLLRANALIYHQLGMDLTIDDDEVKA
ncbi:hypothetical protein C8Q77DRAFT_1097155 [Trametes polyzona]|nr:hypothetical protein C8Q77DRAFT_1097155 [Trametes polyzona]